MKKIETECPICYTTFTHSPSQKRVNCSLACAWISRKKIVVKSQDEQMTREDWKHIWNLYHHRLIDLDEVLDKMDKKYVNLKAPKDTYIFV